MIKINNYPQLKLISWNIHVNEITEDDALGLYETNWRYIDQSSLTNKERKLIERLIRVYGKGLLHV